MGHFSPLRDLSIGKRLNLSMWLTAALPMLLLFVLLSFMVYRSIRETESNQALRPHSGLFIQRLCPGD